MEEVIKIGLPGNFHPRVQFPRPIPQNYPGSNHLPPSIRLRILNYTIHRIVTQGGSDAASVVRGLARMASVCRKWKRVAYREREKGWMKAGHEGMSNTLGKGARLHDYLEDAPNGERCVGGALTLVVVVCEPGGDVSKLHRTWDKHLVDVARACSNTKSLMMEVNNGRRLNLAGEFKCSFFSLLCFVSDSPTDEIFADMDRSREAIHQLCANRLVNQDLQAHRINLSPSPPNSYPSRPRSNRHSYVGRLSPDGQNSHSQSHQLWSRELSPKSPNQHLSTVLRLFPVPRSSRTRRFRANGLDRFYPPETLQTQSPFARLLRLSRRSGELQVWNQEVPRRESGTTLPMQDQAPYLTKYRGGK